MNQKILKDQYIPTTEFYSQLIDSLRDYSILTLGKDHMINSWSSGSTKIFGYETEEVIGKPFEMLFTEEDKKNGVPDKEIETSLKKGRAADNRWHLCKDGSKFYAYGLVFPFTGLKGELLGYVKILQDLTERKKSEDAIKKYVKELEELNTHKENILAILSHDLRSPLTGIVKTLEYLRGHFDKMQHGKIEEMLKTLHLASKDELNTLDYLVEWAKIKYASDTFSPTKIELPYYIKKVFDILSETAAIKTVNLHHEVEENISVFADGKMLLSVLQNIVSNAIKHSHIGGKIIVSAKKKEDKIIIEIKDTGTGMSKDIKEKLFTSHVYSISKEKNENKGAGIGLLLVKGFLEKNSGEIWVESEEGKGSSFYFTLPINKPFDEISKAHHE